MDEELRALVEQRNKLLAQNEELLTRTAREDGKDESGKPNLTPDQEQEFDKRAEDIDSLTRQLERYHKAKEQRAAAEQSTGRLNLGTRTGATDPPAAPDPGLPDASEERAAVEQYMAEGYRSLDREQRRIIDFRRQAFRAFALNGPEALSERARSLFGERVNLDAQQQAAVTAELVAAGVLDESRAQSVGTTTAGGHTVPDDMMRSLTEAEAAWGGMFSAGCEVLQTSTGRQIPMPTDDDTSNTGAILDENTEVDELDVTFGQKVLDAYTYTSKLVRASRQLIEDSTVDLDAYLGRKFGRRLGTAINAHLTTGTGSSQPNGVVTASTLGKTAASATAVTYLELVDLKFSVDPAYRLNGRWMFEDATLKAIHKLLDGDNRPIFQPDVQQGRIDRIHGDPYTINQDMASMTTGQKTVLYGDFFNYKIRVVRGILMLRLVERFAEFNQIGFVAFQRADGELVDAGTAPIKHLIQA